MKSNRMTTVYLLTWEHPHHDPYDGGCPDNLGVWSTRALAEEAARKDAVARGHPDDLRGYEVAETIVDGGPA